MESRVMTGRVVLLGHEIGYSASPAINNAAFAALGLPVRYALRDLTADELPGVIDELRRDAFLGANVTKPFKLAAAELVDGRSQEVERLGAANTLVRADGRLTAYNTDLPALRGELAELVEPGGQALVLGAGGASRAVIAALADLGWRDVRVVDRARWATIREQLVGARLLVNATPIGTASDETPIPTAWLRRDLAVLDLVYRPSPTGLVRAARALGAPARGGAGMLLRQAAASVELWTLREAPLDAMRAALIAELGEEANV
jgi:shikimate dehydrogenase